MIKYFNFNSSANHLVNILKNKIPTENISIQITAASNNSSNWELFDATQSFDSFSDICTLIDLHIIEKLLDIYKDKNYSALNSIEYLNPVSYIRQKDIDKIFETVEIEENDLIFFSVWDFNIFWTLYLILRLFEKYGEKYIRSKLHMGGISIDICDASYKICNIFTDNIHRNKSIPELVEELFENVKYTERAFQRDLWNNDWKDTDYETSIITYYRKFLGCYNDCSFCTCSTGNYRKNIYPSLINDNFEDEIKFYNEKFRNEPSFKQVYISNNNHTKKEFKNFLDILIRNNNVLPFSMYYEFELIDFEDIARIKDADCFKSWGTLFLGLDSVNPDLQKMIHTKKRNKTSGWIEKMLELRKNGINAIAPIIYGFPFYKYNLNEWIIEYKAMNKINSHSDSLSPLLIFPNTGIFNQLKSTNSIEYKKIDYWNIEVPRKYHYEYMENNRHVYKTIVMYLSDDADYNRHVEPWLTK